METIKNAVIFVTLVMIFGVFSVFSQKAINKHKVNNWPSVEGTVLSSRVCTKLDNLTECHYPIIKYQYTVDGKEYKGATRTTLSLRYFNKKDAQAIINKHPEGSTVTVHYNPKDPAKSTIPN